MPGTTFGGQSEREWADEAVHAERVVQPWYARQHRRSGGARSFGRSNVTHPRGAVQNLG
jgi:hypothetical protein